MILSHCLQVTVAVGLMTGQHAVVDVVGGQHLPQRVQVTLGMRFQEAPNQGFVLLFLNRHRSFLLTLGQPAFLYSGSSPPSMMPSTEVKHTGWMAIHPSAGKWNSANFALTEFSEVRM